MEKVLCRALIGVLTDNVINKYGTAAEERINKMEKKEQLYEGKAKKGIRNR